MTKYPVPGTLYGNFKSQSPRLLLEKDFATFADDMNKVGQENGVDIRVMHEDIFNSMHRI